MAEWRTLPDDVLDYLDTIVDAHGIDALQAYVDMIIAVRAIEARTNAYAYNHAWE